MPRSRGSRDREKRLRARRHAVLPGASVRRAKAGPSPDSLYRDAVLASPDAVLLHSDGAIVLVNDAMVRLFRARDAAELVGRPAMFMLPEEMAKDVAERIGVLYAGRSLPRTEQRYRLLDGSWIDVEVAALPVRFEGRPAAHVNVRDISERKRAEDNLRRFRLAMDSSADMILLIDRASMRYVDVNPAVTRLLGYTRDEMLALGPQDVLPASRESLERSYDELIAHPSQTGSMDSYYRCKDGSELPFESTRHVIRSGGSWIIAAISRDIRERLHRERQIEYLATHDGLTGLPNRNLLGDRAAQALTNARRQHRLAALLLLDLDNFKLHNDSFGHVGGDILLKEVGARVAGVLREGDTLARLGGDEFAALLADLARVEDLAAVVAKIRAAFAEPFSIDGREVFLTASVGISAFPADGEELGTLLRHADAAMYKAKESGRDGVQYFTPELNRRAAERLTMEADLRRALARGEFRLFYQPQVDLYTRRIVGAEALVRWQHPERGMVSPAQFIGIAEESGLIVSLGNWILDEGCRQLRAWHDAELPSLRVAFNVSARQFRDGSLRARLGEALSRSRLDASEVELEVTENLVMGSAESFVSSLRALKDLGVMLSIDDFGTGYSSLSYLSRFPIDRLKIDQSFVRGIGAVEHSASIARTVIALGRSLGLSVVAEGVETFEQLEFLRVNGCHEVQGYYFGRPMPAEAFEALVREGLSPGLWSGG
jgi:diguanylate cyclase (GGDEF)-like protein/PAS domain S-box-containing protein